MHSFKRHCNILLACAEEAADARNRRHYLPRLVDQNLLDVADLVFVGIVNVLLVPVGHSLAWLGQAVCILALDTPEGSNWGRAACGAGEKLASVTCPQGAVSIGKNEDTESASCTNSAGPALALCVRP
jgi:hypothetical protein